MKDPTCAERLPEHLRGRLEDLRLLVRVADEDATDEDLRRFRSFGYWQGDDADDAVEAARDALNEYGLSVERRTVLRWTLSTGGPADGFDITYDSEGDAVRASYWFHDWFDGAEASIDEATMEMVDGLVNPDGYMVKGLDV